MGLSHGVCLPILAGMLARLILSLLLAAFALPAMATLPCHDQTAPAMVMAMPSPGHHPAPAPAMPDDRAMVHACIGCIPPSTLKAAPTAMFLAKTAEIRIAGPMRFDPGKAPAPDTPPPRAEA